MRDALDRLRDWCRRDPAAATAWTITMLLIVAAAAAGLAPRARGPHAEPEVRLRAISGVESIRIEGVDIVRARLDHHKSISIALPINVSVGESIRIETRNGLAQTAHARVDFEAAIGTSLRVFDRPRGQRLSVVLADSDSLDMIVPVPMERYVACVLSGELFGDWPAECFRAQAIATRSYVAHQMARSTDRNYDVDADDRDQVFLAGEPLPKAVNAALGTRGLVLTDSEGGVLRAYFSSTCGGRAASARQVWPARGSLSFNAAEPLNGPVRAHACDGAPLFRWRRERGTAELSGRIAAWGERVGHAARRLGRLTAVRVIETAPSGRPGTYELADVNDRKVTIRADDLRVAMNFASGSQLSRGAWIPSNDFEVHTVGEHVTISGRGFGHGVGLCQYCAAEWAREGYRSEQMLSAFYPGARLARLYDGHPESP